MDKGQKEKELAVLKEKLTKAKQIMIADHTGVNVAELTALRRKLKAAGSEFRVSKNTLLKLAVRDTAYQVLEGHFSGPTAIIFGYDDPSVPAKIIHNAIKETERPRFKAYYVDGRVYGLNDMKKIAELPSKEVVLATLMGTIQGPISQFISLLEAATRDFIGTLDVLAKSKQG